MGADHPSNIWPHTAMVLAAGLGTRMRPLTLARPKPLIEIGGKPLIDHMLDKLARVGVRRTIVNVHYLPDQVEAHLRKRTQPEIMISDERDLLLETGGALAKAQEWLGLDPVFVCNTDQVWTDSSEEVSSGAARMLAAGFDPERMDIRLLLARREASLGYDGAGDFFLDPTGRLIRRGNAPEAPYVFAGLYVMRPQILAGHPVAPFSANALFNEAAAQGRLYGQVMTPFWMHVGDPDALAAAEARMSTQAMA